MVNLLRHLISRWIPTYESPVGRVLRWPLQAVPDDSELRVLTGPNRGFRWVAGSSSHGCWIGNYERPLADQLWSSLSPGDVFYDIGANAGYYTLLGSRAVGPEGEVKAFEPVPENVSKLMHHLLLNGIANVDVFEVALLDRSGRVCLALDDGSTQARLSSDGTLAVEGRTLDVLDLSPPDVVKMDVEGAEAAVLRGGIETIREHRPLVFFSTHGEVLRAECYSLLTEVEYKVRSLPGSSSDHIAEPASRDL